jgi:hypothetical protein
LSPEKTAKLNFSDVGTGDEEGEQSTDADAERVNMDGRRQLQSRLESGRDPIGKLQKISGNESK